MTELVSAEISLSTEGLAECESLDLINRKLSDVEENLKRYTCTANRDDYAFAVFSGLLAGAMDSLIVGETKIEAADISLSHRQVNQFIQQFAGQKEGDGGQARRCHKKPRIELRGPSRQHLERQEHKRFC